MQSDKTKVRKKNTLLVAQMESDGCARDEKTGQPIFAENISYSFFNILTGQISAVCTLYYISLPFQITPCKTHSLHIKIRTKALHFSFIFQFTKIKSKEVGSACLTLLYGLWWTSVSVVKCAACTNCLGLVVLWLHELWTWWHWNRCSFSAVFFRSPPLSYLCHCKTSVFEIAPNCVLECEQ